MGEQEDTFVKEGRGLSMQCPLGHCIGAMEGLSQEGLVCVYTGPP